MKLFLALLLATLCAATGYGQTMKALSYNTTNGVVAYSSTNVLTFTNEQLDLRTIGADGTQVWDVVNNLFFTDLSLQNSSISFNGTNAAFAAATTRTNLNLGATWLTNTNVTNFCTAIGLGETSEPQFQAILLTEGTNTFTLSSLAGVNRTNLGLGLPALTNTNNANFQAAVFTTNAAPTNSANVNGIGFNTAVAWMEVTVSTNGTNHSFRIPLFR
jgi:hypothetical protein